MFSKSYFVEKVVLKIMSCKMIFTHIFIIFIIFSLYFSLRLNRADEDLGASNDSSNLTLCFLKRFTKEPRYCICIQNLVFFENQIM